ncbi:MAG: multidrug transporter, partial [Jatrophihabitantaceae bacterium]|nr:multidrug transporter [Jatrophihabitantaceae bacterium]
MADYRIHIDQAHIDLLLGRLARIRWPSPIDGAGWERGTDIAYLRDLVEHWKSRFDWRAVEVRLNQLPQVKVEVDGLGLHAVHQRSSVADAPAVLLLHGWPDCFVRYEKALPLLRDAHVVVPSLPGYGFSDQPAEAGWSIRRMADAMAELMTSLDYEHFAVSGGDIGGGVALRLAIRHKARISGLHLTDVPFGLTSQLDPGTLAEAEAATIAAVRQWQATEGAYAM